MMPEHPFPQHPFKRWMRHAGVPRGLLRFYMLKLLSDKPRSGSEIIEEIEKETGGQWRPSPGSIYPLLAWLQDKGYAEPTPKDDSGLKRYALTEKGKGFLRAQAKFGERFRKKLEFLAPALVGGFHFGINSEELRKIREPARRFVMAVLDLRMTLGEDLSDQTVEEVARILNEGAEKIEAITERIKKR